MQGSGLRMARVHRVERRGKKPLSQKLPRCKVFIHFSLCYFLVLFYRQVTDNVKKSCKASSLDKYLMYVGDADRVTKLLLSLSRRLTKVNSVLVSLEGNDDEEQKVWTT